MLRALNDQAGKLAGLALLALLARHARAWRRERQALETLPDAVPAPLQGDWPDHPSVSILVAAWNEAELLPALIDSFRRLQYPNLQLVLCAGGEDGTYELARRWQSEHVVVLEQRPGEGKFRALARSFLASSGQIIMLTDADCILDQRAFTALIHPLLAEGEVAATGRFRPLARQQGQPFVRQQWAQQRYPQIMEQSQYSLNLAGANSALRRDLLNGVWDAEGAGAGDDLYLAMRIRQAGARIRFAPESCVETAYPATLRDYVRQQARWRRVHLAQAGRFREVAFLRHVRRTLAVETAMLLLPLASFAGRAGAATWLLAWSSYLLAYLRYTWLLNQVERRAGGGGFALIQIVVANLAASALALIEAALPGRRERW